jgi:hypothetical protein
MITCEQCLSNLNNGNLALLRSGIEAWLEEQELDAAGTMEILQSRVCESCLNALN